MRRIATAVLAVTVAALSASADALADGAPPAARAARTTTVRLAKTNLGKILVSGSGAALYMFTKDGRNADKCVTISGCRTVWPALTSSGRPVGGTGVKASRLSTIRLPDGARQVTYDGHPLYTYSFSSGPEDTSYVGASEFGGRWYAVGSTGHAVK